MKRTNFVLLIVLAAAIVCFGFYQIWIRNLIDTTGPEITIEEGILEISVEDPEEALMQGVRAVDDHDGDVTAGMLIERIYGITADNVTTVTYAAFDASGNVTKAQRQIRYRDYHAPRFTLDNSMTFAQGSGFNLLRYVGAVDVMEGDIRRRVHATLISDTGSIAMEGKHRVKLQVTNSLGDISEMVIPVEVYNSDWYTARVELSEYLIYLEKGAAFDPLDYLVQFTVRDETAELRYGIPAGITASINNGVNTNIPGVYEVTYILTQTVSMDSFSGIAKLIVVVE